MNVADTILAGKLAHILCDHTDSVSYTGEGCDECWDRCTALVADVRKADSIPTH